MYNSIINADFLLSTVAVSTVKSIFLKGAKCYIFDLYNQMSNGRVKPIFVKCSNAKAGTVNRADC